VLRLLSTECETLPTNSATYACTSLTITALKPTSQPAPSDASEACESHDALERL